MDEHFNKLQLICIAQPHVNFIFFLWFHVKLASVVTVL